MSTTTVQQIQAVQQARKEFKNMQWFELDQVLNDAATTLLGVDMIGIDRINSLPLLIKLLQKAQKSLTQLGDRHLVKEINEALNKLNK